MAEYLFTARTPSGRELTDKIDADSAATARQKLEAMSLHSIVIHTDDFAARMYGENLVESKADIDPALRLRINRQGGTNLLLQALKGHAIFLILLLGWNAYSLFTGDVGLVDLLGFACTIGLIWWIVWLSIPAMLFESLLHAQLWGLWSVGEQRVAQLRRFKQGASLKPHMLDYYQAKNLIGNDRFDEGMALFAQHRGLEGVPDMLWMSLQASLFDKAKRYDEAGKLMQQLTVTMPDSAQVWLDWALNQALHGDLDTAKRAVKKAEQLELNPVMSAVVPLVHGEIALREGRYKDAASQYAQAMLGLSPFMKLAALRPMFILVEARYAVALARCGKLEAAQQAWQIAGPVLTACNEKRYIDDWNAAERAAEAGA